MGRGIEPGRIPQGGIIRLLLLHKTITCPARGPLPRSRFGFDMAQHARGPRSQNAWRGRAGPVWRLARAAVRRAELPLLLCCALPWQVWASGSATEDAEIARPGLSLLAPTDRGLRSDLAWLVDRGVLGVSLGTWPIPSTALRAAWAAVDVRSLDAADADALARVQRAVRRSTDSVRLAARVNSARHPSLDGGDAARGSAEGSLAFYAGEPQWGGRLMFGTTADSLTPGGQQGNLDGSYLAVLLPGTVIAAGVAERRWGPGQFTSPILSTAARPIAGLFVRRAEDTAPETSWLNWIGPWGYEISAGRLAHYDPQGTRTIGLRVYTRPWPNVEIGASSSLLWAGQGRPHDWVAFRNALLGNSNIDDPTTQGDDPSDGIAGFDLRVSAPNRWGGSWVAYLHLAGEDEAGSLPTKMFGTVGVQGKAVFVGQRLEATLEATDTMLDRRFAAGSGAVPSPAYTHGAYADGYYQGRLPIGAHIGGGGQFYALGLGWTPVDDPGELRVFGTLFRGRVSETGPQSINAAFGAPGSLSGFSLAFDGETPGGVKWQVGLSVQHYPGGDRPVLGLQAGIDVPILAGR